MEIPKEIPSCGKGNNMDKPVGSTEKISRSVMGQIVGHHFDIIRRAKPVEVFLKQCLQTFFGQTVDKSHGGRAAAHRRWSTKPQSDSDMNKFPGRQTPKPLEPKQLGRLGCLGDTLGRPPQQKEPGVSPNRAIHAGIGPGGSPNRAIHAGIEPGGSPNRAMHVGTVRSLNREFFFRLGPATAAHPPFMAEAGQVGGRRWRISQWL